MGYADEAFIEYDLDAADKQWLEQYNQGQNRLPQRRLEMLLWRLELANAAATERAFGNAGEHHPLQILQVLGGTGGGVEAAWWSCTDSCRQWCASPRLELWAQNLPETSCQASSCSASQTHPRA